MAVLTGPKSVLWGIVCRLVHRQLSKVPVARPNNAWIACRALNMRTYSELVGVSTARNERELES